MTEQENNSQKEENITINKKTAIYIVGTIVALIVLGIGIWSYMNKSDAKKGNTNSDSLKISKKDTNIVKDTIKKENDYEGEGEEGEEETFSKCNVIASDAIIMDAPNENGNKIDKKKFGSEIYVKEYYNIQDKIANYVGIYNQKPSNPNAMPDGYINFNSIVQGYNFEEYKKSFSLPEFAVIPGKFKKIILENKNYNNNSYYPTEDANRSKNCVAYGDYNVDGIVDVAIVLDNTKEQKSKFMIFCINKFSKMPYLAYEEGYSDYIKISTLKKGSEISNSSDGQNEASILNFDAVNILNEYSNYVVLYDKDSNKFNVNAR